MTVGTEEAERFVVGSMEEGRRRGCEAGLEVGRLGSESLLGVSERRLCEDDVGFLRTIPSESSHTNAGMVLTSSEASIYSLLALSDSILRYNSTSFFASPNSPSLVANLASCSLAPANSLTASTSLNPSLALLHWPVARRTVARL